MKKKRKTQASTKPVAVAAVEEKTAAAVKPVEEPAAPAVAPVVKEAAPVVEKPAPAAKTPEPAPEKPAPAAAPEEPKKKPVRRIGKPKAAAAEKTPKPKAQKEEKPKAQAEEKPKKTLVRRTKVDIPEALGLYVQYQGGEVDMAAIAETAKAEFKAAHKRGSIASLKIYLKPEEHTAYYVINDDFHGQVAL